MKVTGLTGEDDSFEVSVNGELIYSKLKTGEFPDNEELTEKVRAMVPKTKGTKKNWKQRCSTQ